MNLYKKKLWIQKTVLPLHLHFVINDIQNVQYAKNI